MVWSSMTWKWPIPVLFCGMNHQKYKFSLISVSFSVGGCWGQNMLLFWKLVDETQIPQSQEYTDTFKQNLTCTFLSIRGNLKYTLCHEGPCIWSHHWWSLFYSDHETYFNYEINVYNGPYLPYGVHNFPFSFTLPYNLPSSFESKDGQVRYEVRGKNLTRHNLGSELSKC